MKIRASLYLFGLVIIVLAFIMPEWLLRYIGYGAGILLFFLASFIKEEEFIFFEEGDDYVP